MMKSEVAKILNDKSIWFTDEYIPNYPDGSIEKQLLEIFAYGVWNDYSSIKSTLPEELQFANTSNAARKLKALTIMTMFEDRTSIQFDELLNTLGIDNTVDLENIIIDLMGARLLIGKIDERNKLVTCERLGSRCVKNTTESLDAIIKEINDFRQNVDNVIKNT